MSAPVDLERLRRTSGGDRAIELELLRIFVEQTDERVVAIGTSLRGQDYAQLREEAHSIKGSAANVGADRLRELASSLEAGMTNGETDRAEAWVEEIVAECERVRAFIEAYRQGDA